MVEQIGNHDRSRVASRLGVDRIDIVNTLVTMLPGTSVTYYGEEIGMENSCAKFPDEEHENPAKICEEEEKGDFLDTWARSPMQWDNTANGGFTKHDKPWIPIGEKYQQVNVNAQLNKPKSHLEIYRSLMKLRKNKAIVESDNFEIAKLNENSFAFWR